MGLNFRPPGGDRTFYAVLFFVFGLVLAWMATRVIAPWNYLTAVASGVIIVCSVGLWFEKQWARLTLVVLLSLHCLTSIGVQMAKGFVLRRAIYAACTAATACSVWFAYRPRGGSGGKGDKPMVSLVLLLREPRYLEARVLAQIVSSAWGGEYSFHEESKTASGSWVLGETPLFAIQSPHGFFIVNNFPRPYWNDKEKILPEIKELRLRKAVEDHTAWLSVDLMQIGETIPKSEDAYVHIARLIAELSGPDCTALIQPEGHRINAWDEELAAKLRNGKDLNDLFARTQAPVVFVEGKNAKMKAAVEEARTRWPEFVEAFKKRDGENFAVKAPITVNGNTEFIWLEVIGLEPEYIHGTLANDPVDLGDLKLGSQVEVPLKDLNDWGYIKNGAPVGMFTVKVLTEKV